MHSWLCTYYFFKFNFPNQFYILPSNLITRPVDLCMVAKEPSDTDQNITYESTYNSESRRDLKCESSMLRRKKR